MHQLDITYHNTYNCKTLKIEDNSIYEVTPTKIKNIILEVKSPGLTSFVPFYLPNEKWKSITLNCSSLKICCDKKCTTLSVLPDGIYEIKYSVAPNLECMVEFNHMRVCQIMSTYIKLLGLYLSNKCTLTNRQIEEIEREFIEIKDTIDASIFSVEERLDSALGLEQYNEAIKRLNRLSNGNFTDCCK